MRIGAAIIGALYLLLWGASGCVAWGVNGSEKCHIGYDPVTHLCVDPPDMPSCSGWSPPGFCWDSSQGEHDEQR